MEHDKYFKVAVHAQMLPWLSVSREPSNNAMLLTQAAGGPVQIYGHNGARWAPRKKRWIVFG
jgi:hypothetical protein